MQPYRVLTVALRGVSASPSDALRHCPIVSVTTGRTALAQFYTILLYAPLLLDAYGKWLGASPLTCASPPSPPSPPYRALPAACCPLLAAHCPLPAAHRHRPHSPLLAFHQQLRAALPTERLATRVRRGPRHHLAPVRALPFQPRRSRNSCRPPSTPAAPVRHFTRSAHRNARRPLGAAVTTSPGITPTTATPSATAARGWGTRPLGWHWAPCATTCTRG